MWFKRSPKTELGSKSYNAKVKQDIIVIQIAHKCRHFGKETNLNITILLSLINYLESYQLFNHYLLLSGHHVDMYISEVFFFVLSKQVGSCDCILFIY